MRPSCWWVLPLVLLSGCGPQASRPTATGAAADPTARPKGIVFKAPDGFEQNPEFRIFYHKGFRTSISPAYQPGAVFETVAAEFTPEALRAEGLTLGGTETREVAGRRTLILKGDRFKGEKHNVFTTVLFPTRDGCVQFTAIYPADVAQEFRDRVDAALIHAWYNEEDE